MTDPFEQPDCETDREGDRESCRYCDRLAERDGQCIQCLRDGAVDDFMDRAKERKLER